MDDDMLLNISLVVTFLGIIILLLLSFYDNIPYKDFNDMRCIDVGKYVKVEGDVYSIARRNNSMSIRLEQRCFQDVFVFESDEDISVNDTVTIHGTIQEYNGRLSILADSIALKEG